MIVGFFLFLIGIVSQLGEWFGGWDLDAPPFILVMFGILWMRVASLEKKVGQ